MINENFGGMPVVNSKATGENINRMRKEVGLSVKDIQYAVGFACPQAVYKWIHGQSVPTIDNLVILAELFGVKVDDIVAVDMV